MQKQYEENVWEKSNDAYALSIRVQTTINQFSIFFVFLLQYQRQTKCLVFFSERRKKTLRNTLSHAKFDWFVLGMRMQIILDSLFARPSSGWREEREKGEFREWTRMERDNVKVKCLAQEHNTILPDKARTRTAGSGEERTNFMRPPRLHTLSCTGRKSLLASLWFKH